MRGVKWAPALNYLLSHSLRGGVLLSLGLSLFFSACSTVPERNAPLKHYDRSAGYRFENLDPGEKNSDSLFVVLTFSGGGTRAAALSYGVLEVLRDTQIVWDGESKRLLDEVDVISSVSGGSLTSAYYTLFGERIFEDYVERVLYKDIQGKLIRQFLSFKNLNRLASPFYGRTDIMAEGFSERIFEEKTYGDLIEAHHRPFLLVNSTDMSLGRQFAFTQDFFDLLYSDLSVYPLGNAVAASAAFPGLLTPMTLKNYEKEEEIILPEWASKQLEQGEPGSLQYRRAQEMQSYLSPERAYVHLVDGGVSDNLGLLPVLENLYDTGNHNLLWEKMLREQVRDVLIITVNANRNPSTDWDSKPNILKIFPTLLNASTKPMETFTAAQLAYMNLFLINEEKERETYEAALKCLQGSGIDPQCIPKPKHNNRFHFVEVSFERMPDPEKRASLNELPTSFKLKKEEVTSLRNAAREILVAHPKFKETLDLMQGEVAVQEVDEAAALDATAK